MKSIVHDEARRDDLELVIEDFDPDARPALVSRRKEMPRNGFIFGAGGSFPESGLKQKVQTTGRVRQLVPRSFRADRM